MDLRNTNYVIIISWLSDVILKILHLIKTMLFAISFHIVKYITIQKFGARFLFKIN